MSLAPTISRPNRAMRLPAALACRRHGAWLLNEQAGATGGAALRIRAARWCCQQSTAGYTTCGS